MGIHKRIVRVQEVTRMLDLPLKEYPRTVLAGDASTLGRCVRSMAKTGGPPWMGRGTSVSFIVLL